MGHEWMKGNKFGVGSGRPRKYKTQEEITEKIDEYFESIKGKIDKELTKKAKTKIWEVEPEPPTVTGLALYLGFSDKSSIYDYAKRDNFSHPVKRAISFIEKYHEIAVAKGGHCTGNIFVLKNFGWKDKVEQEITTTQEIIWKEEKTYEADSETNEGS